MIVHTGILIFHFLDRYSAYEKHDASREIRIYFMFNMLNYF